MNYQLHLTVTKVKMLRNCNIGKTCIFVSSLVLKDMVAVPTMIFNGMEHWGMVTYRESGMLYEEGVSSEADKEWTAILIAHELSHQV